MSEQPSGAEQWRRMLESMLGPDAAAEAMRALESSGMDLSRLESMPGMPSDPSQFAAAMAQMRQVLSADDDGGSSDWKVAHDVARQVAHLGGDPAVSAAQAESARRALQAADLWLDVATDLPPSGGPQQAVSRAEWVERTLPVWRQVADPVGVSVAQALATTMGTDGPGLPEGLDPAAAGLLGGVDMGAMVRKLGRLSFAMQVGQGAGTLAREVFGATDTGLPLLTDPAVLLVPANLDAFAEDLDVPTDEVWHFLAVREAAHARLFTHVPWLRSQLLSAVEQYARGIEIDLRQLEDAVRDIDPTDMEQLRSALAGGIFSPERTESQERALSRLETILALIEGWVEEVTAAAVAPHLPHAVPLREMLRRRRAAGGPAEDTFRTLVGLELRPRRARDAALLWAAVTRELGAAERDELWSHPDVFPTAEDLDDPGTYLSRRESSRAEGADVDEALTMMLEGNLGYSEGAREHDAARAADSAAAESAGSPEQAGPEDDEDPERG
ncbi:zinc-dependent metalloprotease [Pseudactinotalea sp. Z1748]|uniref:zinc-dependent metalloprotease n=1 Tax=Pseudactinotalea sp. Z1748 TaxID=3413027 RepID=UPI003C7E9F3E